MRIAFCCLALVSSLAVAASDVSDLPLSEVPSAGSSPVLALFVTGDGGWAALDKGVSARLAELGISTVGLDSRSYFWHPRTPEQTTQDIERVLRHYLAAWKKTKVLLIGYSFGADVLPFVVNRLPQDLRAQITGMSLLGAETTALFEVHVADWLPGISTSGPPVLPQLATLGSLPVQCIYGEGERNTLCTRLPAGHYTVERIGSGHHFDRDYTLLADRILAFAGHSH